MNSYMKYGVSAVALLAAASFAQAQTNEREGGKAPGVERREGEGAKQPEKRQERTSPSIQNQGKSSEREKEGKQPQSRTAQEPNKAEKQPEKRAEGEPNKNEQKGASERTQQRQASDRNRQPRVRINVTPAQKTRLHDFIMRDSGIHRYRRSDINFSLDLGTRIPDSIEFYDPPAEFVQIDPELEGYKIVILDDVVLIIDADTREIVDVLQLA